MPTALSVIATNYCASAGRACKPTGKARSRIQSEKPEQLHGKKINHVCIMFHRVQLDATQSLLIPRYKHEPQKAALPFQQEDSGFGQRTLLNRLVQLLEPGVPSWLVLSWLVQINKSLPTSRDFAQGRMFLPRSHAHTQQFHWCWEGRAVVIKR